MFDGPDPEEVEDWVCVLQGSKEHEVAMAQNYLTNMEIPSNILSKRDSAHSLNVGEMALIYLYVPEAYAEEAQKALDDLDLPPGEEEE